MKKVYLFIVVCFMLNFFSAKAARQKKVNKLDTLSSGIIIPNVFSPNRDGVNDVFNVTGNFTGLEIEIFNRWGELLFKSNQINEGWNGRTTSGTEVPEGTYFYIITIEIIDRSNTYKGSITLTK